MAVITGGKPVSGGVVIPPGQASTMLATSGAPTSGAGGTYNTRVVNGQFLIRTDTGQVYRASAVSGTSVTWTLVA